MGKTTSQLAIPKMEMSFEQTDKFHMLDHAFHRPVMSITAPGGFGKSALIANYLLSRARQAFWFNFAEKKWSLEEFVFLLAEGLGISGDEDEILHIQLSILESIAYWESPLSIVLDDFHMNESPEIPAFIHQLIQHASPSINIVLLNRTKPEFPLTKLKIQNKLVEWNEQELTFTKEDTGSFFQQENKSLTAAELDFLHKKLGGWPAALSLVAASLKGSVPVSSEILLEQIPFKELFEEYDPLLKEADDTELSVLYQSSLIHELDPNVIEELGIDYSLLEEIWLNRTFIRHMDGAKSYIPIFRDYLYQKLTSLIGKKQMRSKHEAAAKIYERGYQYYFSFAHFLAAGHFEEAARLMQKMMNMYTPEQFLLLLDGSLEEICPAISTAAFSLFLFRCVPIALLQSYIEPIKKSLASIESEAIPFHKILLRHRLGLVLFYSGEIDDAKELFMKSLKESRAAGSHDLISVNLSLIAQCCRFTGEIEEGIQFARMALTNAEQFNTVDSRMHSSWILTELLLEKKELALAEPLLKDLARLTEEYSDEGAKVYPLIAMGKYYRLTGELNKALECTESGIRRAKKFMLDTDLGWGYLELGMIHLELGEKERGIEQLKKSEKHFSHYRYFNQLLQAIISQTNSGSNAVSAIAERMAPGLSVSLLGNFQLMHNGNEISIKRKSSMRLMVYLASQYGQKIPKERLLEDLFPDGSYHSQNNRFYVSLSALRKSLEPDAASGRQSKYIIQTGESIYFDDQDCSIDLKRFHSLIRASFPSQEEKIANFLEAETLYSGDLLTEFPYESFLEPIRDQTKKSFLDILEEIGLYYWSIEEYTKAQTRFDRILQMDEYNEPIYWKYMRNLLDKGFIKHAKDIAASMELKFEIEMGVPVKQKLQTLFDFYR
ncbi:BTAD domain-containing putative transcriptional regulator [Falsibacillus pallidus]|uniref:AfsR/SARP family transcriptional regulator n=1 Tax=Falsibacillus pallidus TaxID=493781 RepID=UPI003D9865F0